MIGSPEGDEAGLYVHVPFCSSICPYCDFAVVRGGSDARTRYVSAVVREAELRAEVSLGFETVYLGGGTPSLLAPEALAELLDALRRSLRIDSGAWLSLEANPEDASAERLRLWRELGVRTVSLGLQALDGDELRFLGRRHRPEEARRALAAALDTGFDTVSIDLIYGLPGQDPERWRRTLEAAAALGPQHISCYQLTVSDGTPFGRRRRQGRLVELEEEPQRLLFEATHRSLEALGYAAYEVSNFALAPGHRSRHNRKYWDHSPYIGIGPSAHSFHDRRRSWNLRSLADWSRALERGSVPLDGSEWLSDGLLALESVLLGLRTVDGIDLAGFRVRHGFDLLARNRELVEREIAGGRLRLTEGRLAPTLAGLAIADGLAAAFSVEAEHPDRGA